jgi:hypothetical protein
VCERYQTTVVLTVALYGAGILHRPDTLRTPSLTFQVRTLAVGREDGEVVLQRLSQRAAERA